MNFYASAKAQRDHWPLHKLSCRVIPDDERDEIQALSLTEAWERVRGMLSTRPDASMVLLMKQMRRRFDQGDDDDASEVVEMQSHTIIRNWNWHVDTDTIAALWAAPGMAQLLLCDEDLLTSWHRDRQKFFPPQGRFPGFEYLVDDDYSTEAQDCAMKELEKDDDDEIGDVRAADKFGYFYFNILLGAAVQSQPSTTSPMDGIGYLRTGPLAEAALARALTLWSDPLVRECADGAVAPTPSLALTFLQQMDAVPPGLERFRFVVALLESAADFSRENDIFGLHLPNYSKQAVVQLVANPTLRSSFWYDADGIPQGTILDRAMALRRVTVYLLEATPDNEESSDYDDDDDDDDFGNPTPSLPDMAAALMAFITTGEMRFQVMYCAAKNGDKHAVLGHENDARAFLTWLLDYVLVRRYLRHIALLRHRCPLPHVVAEVTNYLADLDDLFHFDSAVRAWRTAQYPVSASTQSERIRGSIKLGILRSIMPAHLYNDYAAIKRGSPT